MKQSLAIDKYGDFFFAQNLMMNIYAFQFNRSCVFRDALFGVDGDLCRVAIQVAVLVTRSELGRVSLGQVRFSCLLFVVKNVCLNI